MTRFGPFGEAEIWSHDSFPTLSVRISILAAFPCPPIPSQTGDQIQTAPPPRLDCTPPPPPPASARADPPSPVGRLSVTMPEAPEPDDAPVAWARCIVRDMTAQGDIISKMTIDLAGSAKVATLVDEVARQTKYPPDKFLISLQHCAGGEEVSTLVERR